MDVREKSTNDKRLIDANKAMEIVRNQGIAHPNAYHLTNYAMLILREAPTVDAVEVVRCMEWISVKDKLPEVGRYVVCIAKRNPFSRFMPMVARIEKNGWVNPITAQYISNATHWMPIPQPPKGE